MTACVAAHMSRHVSSSTVRSLTNHQEFYVPAVELSSCVHVAVIVDIFYPFLARYSIVSINNSLISRLNMANINQSTVKVFEFHRLGAYKKCTVFVAYTVQPGLSF